MLLITSIFFNPPGHFLIHNYLLCVVLLDLALLASILLMLYFYCNVRLAFTLYHIALLIAPDLVIGSSLLIKYQNITQNLVDSVKNELNPIDTLTKDPIRNTIEQASTDKPLNMQNPIDPELQTLRKILDIDLTSLTETEVLLVFGLFNLCVIAFGFYHIFWNNFHYLGWYYTVCHVTFESIKQTFTADFVPISVEQVIANLEKLFFSSNFRNSYQYALSLEPDVTLILVDWCKKMLLITTDPGIHARLQTLLDFFSGLL